MRIFYTKKDIVNAEYNDVKNIIITTWSNLYYDEIFKECLMAQLDKIIKETIIIIDLKSAIGTPSNNIILWLIEYYIPKLKKSGFKSVIIIESDNIMFKKAHMLLISIWRNFSKKTMIVSDISEAMI